MRKKINLLSRPFLAAFCGSVVSQSFFWNFFQLFATACVSGSVWQFFWAAILSSPVFFLIRQFLFSTFFSWIDYCNARSFRKSCNLPFSALSHPHWSDMYLWMHTYLWGCRLTVAKPSVEVRCFWSVLTGFRYHHQLLSKNLQLTMAQPRPWHPATLFWSRWNGENDSFDQLSLLPACIDVVGPGQMDMILPKVNFHLRRTVCSLVIAFCVESLLVTIPTLISSFSFLEGLAWSKYCVDRLTTAVIMGWHFSTVTICFGTRLGQNFVSILLCFVRAWVVFAVWAWPFMLPSKTPSKVWKTLRPRVPVKQLWKTGQIHMLLSCACSHVVLVFAEVLGLLLFDRTILAGS